LGMQIQVIVFEEDGAKNSYLREMRFQCYNILPNILWGNIC